MQTFWTLLKESVITTALITLLSVCAVIYLLVTGQPVPELLEALTMMFVGALFGGKVENIKNKL